MKQKSKSSIISLIIFIIIVIFIIVGIFAYNFTKRTIWNTGNVSGNTAGNLYNKGLFCEYNDKIYFSNSYDQGDIYVMDLNGMHIKKFYDDTASYINVSGKYIYYARNNLNETNISSVFRINLFGVYRLDINGKNNVTLSNETCGAVSLGNNKLFYQHYDSTSALSLRSVSIDGSNETNLDASAINPSCIKDGMMYYNNVSDNFNLCTMNVESASTQTIYEGACWHPIYDGTYVYFMDIDNNYSLARVNLLTMEKEDLNTGRIDTYNLYGDYIFYQVNDATNPCLCRMKKDGTNVEKIIDGNFTNINVTSNYVYFNQFGYDTPMYKVRTTGDINVTRFDEAEEAVQKKK